MDMKELRTSMDTIRKTSGEFIEIMTETMQGLMREQTQKEQLEEQDLVGAMAEAEINALPDSMVGLSEMHQYGYHGEEMLPLSQKRAMQLYQEGVEVFCLYSDDTEVRV